MQYSVVWIVSSVHRVHMGSLFTFFYSHVTLHMHKALEHPSIWEAVTEGNVVVKVGEPGPNPKFGVPLKIRHRYDRYEIAIMTLWHCWIWLDLIHDKFMKFIMSHEEITLSQHVLGQKKHVVKTIVGTIIIETFQTVLYSLWRDETVIWIKILSIFHHI